MSSFNYEEYKTYIVFENLLKSIIGRYILNNHNIQSFLPEDFIDMDNKTITVHCDSGSNNLLILQYHDRKIKIHIIKNNEQSYHRNSIRICTSGSMYEFYYQEFIDFYEQLLILEKELNKEKNLSLKNKDV